MIVNYVVRDEVSKLSTSAHRLNTSHIVMEAEVQKYMFTYHIEGQFNFVYIVPSGLISIFLDVECDKISFGLQPTRFFLNSL